MRLKMNRVKICTVVSFCVLFCTDIGWSQVSIDITEYLHQYHQIDLLKDNKVKAYQYQNYKIKDGDTSAVGPATFVNLSSDYSLVVIKNRLPGGTIDSLGFSEQGLQQWVYIFRNRSTTNYLYDEQGKLVIKHFETERPSGTSFKTHDYIYANDTLRSIVSKASQERFDYRYVADTIYEDYTNDLWGLKDIYIKMAVPNGELTYLVAVQGTIRPNTIKTYQYREGRLIGRQTDQNIIRYYYNQLGLINYLAIEFKRTGTRSIRKYEYQFYE